MTDTPKPQRRQVSLSQPVNGALERFRAHVVMKRPSYISWRAMTYSQLTDMLVMHAISDLMDVGMLEEAEDPDDEGVDDAD